MGYYILSVHAILNVFLERVFYIQNKTKISLLKLKLPVALGSPVSKLKNRLLSYLRLSQGKIKVYSARWSLATFSNHLTCAFLVREREGSLIVPLPTYPQKYLLNSNQIYMASKSFKIVYLSNWRFSIMSLLHM